jgi:hypothetical protein
MAQTVAGTNMQDNDKLFCWKGEGAGVTMPIAGTGQAQGK